MNGREYFAKRMETPDHRACIEAMMEKLDEPFARMLQNYIEWSYDDGRHDGFDHALERQMRRIA